MWQPIINVYDPKHAARNLLEFIRENNADALEWANDGEPLDEFRSFNLSGRIVTQFPSITLIDAAYETSYDTMITGSYSTTFECAIQHGDLDILAEQTTRYEMALESLIANCPETTLRENNKIDISYSLAELRTTPIELGERNRRFIQIFQTEARWEIEAAAFME